MLSIFDAQLAGSVMYVLAELAATTRPIEI